MLQHAAQCGMTSTPTKSVRFSVPVTPEVQATFQRLAEASGRSMAASLGQWLTDTKDAAELMAVNLERLREAPGDFVMRVKLHTSSVEEAAELAIEEAIQRAEEQADRYGMLGGPGGQVEDARTALPASLTPPSSNTGGKVHKGGKRSGG